jgi:hypothetical protein
MNAITRIPYPMDHRRKYWRKHLLAVDRGKTDGYAFTGPWLRAGERAELPVGSLILGYDTAGSVKNWYPVVRVWRVGDGGALDEVLRYEGRVAETSWALAVRDRVADLVEPTTVPTDAPAPDAATDSTTGETRDLSQVPTAVLLAELARRGVVLPEAAR